MKIASTNIASPVQLSWNGKQHLSGIYKKAQSEGIFLQPEGVAGDTIGNPRVHGDRQKAVYLFSTDTYGYWKKQYPGLDWSYGMFGENLSIEGLDEKGLIMGSEYRLGKAHIRITTPREPCFKLGIRFGDQEIIDRFVAYGRPGSYAEVLQGGPVQAGDTLRLESQPENGVSIADFFSLWYGKEKDQDLLLRTLKLDWLSASKRKKLMGWVQTKKEA